MNSASQEGPQNELENDSSLNFTGLAPLKFLFSLAEKALQSSKTMKNYTLAAKDPKPLKCGDHGGQWGTMWDHGGQRGPTGTNGGQRGPTGANGTGANGQRIWDLDTHTPDLEEIYRTLTDKLFREQCVYCGFDHFRIANIGLKCLPKTVPEKVFSSNSWCEMCAQCELNLSKQNYFPFSFIEL